MRSPLMFVHHPRRLLRSDGVPPSWVGRGYHDRIASNLVERCASFQQCMQPAAAPSALSLVMPTRRRAGAPGSGMTGSPRDCCGAGLRRCHAAAEPSGHGTPRRSGVVEARHATPQWRWRCRGTACRAPTPGNDVLPQRQPERS